MLRSLFISSLLLALMGCRRSSSETVPSSPVDCQEDLGCFRARAQTCMPTSVLWMESFALKDVTLHLPVRYELLGRVQGRCHLRRTRLPSQSSKTAEEVPPQPDDPFGLKTQSLMQCLYSESQIAELTDHLQRGAVSSSDMDVCFPGDGTCGDSPLLAPGCVLGECLLGRWTFTCEANEGRQIFRCEGSRLSDVRRGCWSRCTPEGHEQVECRPPRDASSNGSSPEPPLRSPVNAPR